MFRPRICRLFCIILFSFYGCKSNGLFDISKIICYFFIAFSLILSERIVFSPAFPSLLTKCQTNRFTGRMLAPKYDWVDSEALLRLFAKYTLLSIRRKRYPDGTSGRHPAFTRTAPLPIQRILLPSNLLTRHSFQRTKPGIFHFHFPKI